MTGGANQPVVTTHERKICLNRVVETDVEPECRRMATLALVSVATEMDIIGAMAGCTFAYDRLLEPVVGVTGRTRQPAVAVLKSETRFGEVIEARVCPIGCRVTVLATLTVDA